MTQSEADAWPACASSTPNPEEKHRPCSAELKHDLVNREKTPSERGVPGILKRTGANLFPCASGSHRGIKTRLDSKLAVACFGSSRRKCSCVGISALTAQPRGHEAPLWPWYLGWRTCGRGVRAARTNSNEVIPCRPSRRPAPGP